MFDYHVCAGIWLAVSCIIGTGAGYCIYPVCYIVKIQILPLDLRMSCLNVVFKKKNLSSSNQVTRLCDLASDNDTVTSVSWSERVSEYGNVKLVFQFY